MKEKQRLESQIASIQSQLSTLPKGTLICARNSNRYKWYQSDGHCKTYIPKSNLQFAQQLALKTYLSLQLNDLSTKLKSIDSIIRFQATDIGSAEKLLISNPEFQKLLAPYFKPLSTDLSEWMNSTFEKNPKYPEQLIHKSTSGNCVRSKSEAMIDTFLHINKIPFRYECALELGDNTFYPDFTIRHPSTGQTYYWEHFGLMDNQSYSQNAYSKLQFYSIHGIIPSLNLIVTFETKESPLTPEMVNHLIQHYFF